MPSRGTPGEPEEVALIFSSSVYRATSDLALSSGDPDLLQIVSFFKGPLVQSGKRAYTLVTK
jgi:hypothetical protein